MYQIGLHKEQIEEELKSRGIQDETILKAISEVIDLNNNKLKSDIPKLLESLERQRKSRSLT